MNEAKLSPDDPLLTAYALGELEDPERAAVEAALADNPALRAAVDAIRATGAQLEAALATEAVPDSPSPALPPARPRFRMIRFPVAYYVIGSLAAAAFAVLMVHYDRPPVRTNPEAAPRQYVEIPLAPSTDAKDPAPDAPAVPTSAMIVVQDTTAPAVPVSKVESSVRLIAANEAANQTAEPLFAGSAGAAPVAPSEAPIGRGAAVTLNPFTLDASKDTGFYAQNTVAGARLNQNTSDTPASAATVTREQLVNTGTLDVGGGLAGGAGAGAPVRMQFAAQSIPNTETYGQRRDNEFVAVASEPLSTFSIDVDTAGYSNVRRFLQSGQLPPRDAVRIEELVNYFPYRYAPPAGNVPFAASLEVAAAPWDLKHRLVRIGLKGREVSQAARPPANLVFLLDVSGSMGAPNRLSLVKESMRLLLGRLRDDDRVAIVTYAGKTGLELASTPVARSREILDALDGLQAFGSTNGGMGIQLAYDIAKANFVPGGVNRVILCTDGDFNVGVTDRDELVRLIQDKAKSNVFLTVLGFGYGNLKDSTLEQLADKGHGNYGYIDSRREAEKLLVEEVNGTLMTIAKDVKIQVEFNPAQASAYRLIGYENRLLKKEDFNNDKIDAGDIGAGHTVTALYEVIPAGADEPLPVISVDELKYQNLGRSPTPEAGGRKPAAGQPKADVSGELLTVKIRYKDPSGNESRKLEYPLTDRGTDFAAASGDFKFAAAVAGFGLALREEPAKASLLADASRWAEAGLSDDPGGYRAEFTGLLRQAQALVR